MFYFVCGYGAAFAKSLKLLPVLVVTGQSIPFESIPLQNISYQYIPKDTIAHTKIAHVNSNIP